jgi:hypothetical protein
VSPLQNKGTTLEAASVIRTGGFFNNFMVMKAYTKAALSMSIVDGLQVSLGMFS